MRRIATWLLVGAVAALGVAAGVDSLRGGDEAERAAAEVKLLPATPPAVRSPELAYAASALRAAGVAGVLTYADEDCGRHGLALPGLDRHPAGDARTCEFEARAILRFGRPSGDPQRILAASCVDGQVELREVGGALLARAPGCAPAWAPDGTLVAIRDGAVTSLWPKRTLVSRDDLAAALGEPAEARQAVWLRHGRLAVLAGTEDGGERVLVLEGRKVVADAIDLRAPARLRASPLGTYLAALTGDRRALVIDSIGRVIPLPRPGRAVAWSSNERWTAIATDDAILVARTGAEPPVARLPIVARDLVWR